MKPRRSGEKADLPIPRQNTERPMFREELMEEICERNNLLEALKRVKQNKGSPGVDGMTMEGLPGFLRENTGSR